jgi:hypothetical protein
MEPLLPWTSNKYYIFWACVCSLSYPSCKVHTPFYVIYGLSGNTIFPCYDIYGTIFIPKLWNVKHVFDCVCNFCLKYCSLYEKTEWDIVINIHVKSSLFFLAFNENWFFKMSNLGKIRPQGAALFHADGRTDGQTDMVKVILAFCKSGNAPKNCLWACVESIIGGSELDILV